MGGVAVKTYSRTQKVRALSSGEAEFYAAVSGATEGLGAAALMADFGWKAVVDLWTDSEACKGLCNRTGLGKVKHMDVQLLWLQDAVRRDRVRLGKVRGDRNPADLMTKHLGRAAIEKNLGKLGFARP